jgi:hypothetical protein
MRLIQKQFAKTTNTSPHMTPFETLDRSQNEERTNRDMNSMRAQARYEPNFSKQHIALPNIQKSVASNLSLLTYSKVQKYIIIVI